MWHTCQSKVAHASTHLGANVPCGTHTQAKYTAHASTHLGASAPCGTHILKARYTAHASTYSGTNAPCGTHTQERYAAHASTHLSVLAYPPCLGMFAYIPKQGIQHMPVEPAACAACWGLG